MPWNQAQRENGLKSRKESARRRDGKIRKAKGAKPELSLYELAGQFDCSHMTVKRALEQQLSLDF